MIILRLLLLLTNLHLKLLSTQGTGADKLPSTQRVKKSKILGIPDSGTVVCDFVCVYNRSYLITIFQFKQFT